MLALRCLARHAVLVPDSCELAGRSVVEAARAVDAVLTLLGTPLDRTVIDDAHRLGPPERFDFGASRQRETWDHHAASLILVSAGAVAADDEIADEEPVVPARIQHDGYRALQDGRPVRPMVRRRAVAR